MLDTSRLEVNVKRLLARCELMAKEDSHLEKWNWKLEKFILALDDMLKELQESPDKPSRDTMTEYTRRVEFLKGVIETSKLTNPIERIVAAQMLPRNSSMISTDLNGPSVTSQIHQKTTAKYSRELRSELFNMDAPGGNSRDPLSSNKLRQRAAGAPAQDQDLDALLKYNRNMQEKIAENMILMTSSMKEHALTANSIIKQDIGSLEKSDKLTDKNAAKLRMESLKLEEHTKSTWRCWVWLMVAFVLVVFFNMILFMKMAKKKP
ncbi:vesicle transport protein USE1 [Venturia canescens]|uniref:vesicle transport protein USE1 n=1 Tax=Venturia canescens TaxID=32260 RepID=UPI001C9CD492|nr:vesicle transport protein USE1 [Venturia canescens]